MVAASQFPGRYQIKIGIRFNFPLQGIVRFRLDKADAEVDVGEFRIEIAVEIGIDNAQAGAFELAHGFGDAFRAPGGSDREL